MLAQASLMFQSLAARCAVAEEDYQLLLHQGFGTPDEFFYKVPNETTLEAFVAGTFFQNTGYADADGNFLSQPRNSVLEAQTFAQGANASSLRRLWHISKELAAHELKSLEGQVSGPSGDLARRKTSTPPWRSKPSISYVNELRGQAAMRGVVDRSDRDMVGSQCIINTLENFRVVSGKFRYMEFEEFTNMEEEEFLAENSSAGRQGDSSVKLLVGEGGLPSAQSEGDEPAFEFKLKQLSDNNFDIIAETLIAETFVLKEKAHDIVQVCLRESMAQLHQIYMDAMRETPKMGFRSVTFNEVRRLDIVMSKDIFKYFSRGEGSYDDGLYFYLQGDGKNNVIWKLLESPFEDAPDRGVEGPPASLRSAPASSMPGPSIVAKRTFSEMDQDNTPEGFAAKRRAMPKPASRLPHCCSECWHPRSLHHKRVFCDRRVEQGDTKVAKTKGAGRAASKVSGKASGGGFERNGAKVARKGVTNVPNFMHDKAVLEVSQDHPQGRKYCFNFHDPNASCNKPSWDKPNKCELSHRCPVYKISGEVCNMAHAQYDHKRKIHG